MPAGEDGGDRGAGSPFWVVRQADGEGLQGRAARSRVVLRRRAIKGCLAAGEFSMGEIPVGVRF
jgi:hypothetical protein